MLDIVTSALFLMVIKVCHLPHLPLLAGYKLTCEGRTRRSGRRVLGSGRIVRYKLIKSLGFVAQPIKAAMKPVEVACVPKCPLADGGFLEAGQSGIPLNLIDDDARVHAALLAFANQTSMAIANLLLANANCIICA